MDSTLVGDGVIEKILTISGPRQAQYPLTLSHQRGLIRIDSNDRALRLSKVEPWNSVRVTFSLGPDAAERLRSLAAEAGGEVLARLGILSVQLRPSEQVISIRVAAGNSPGGGAAPPATPAPAPPAPQSIDPSTSRVIQAPQLLPPLTPAPTPAAPQNVVQVQVAPQNRPFHYPQTPASHHLQLQPKAAPNHYPPPPYPGALARPSVLAGAPAPPPDTKDDASPLLVNLLQDTAAPQAPAPPPVQHLAPVQQHAAPPQPTPVPTAPPLQPPSQVGVRGFNPAPAPHAVVHHRPPQAPSQHQALPRHQAPQQQVSVVQAPPTPAPSQPVDEEKPRSPSPPPSQDLTSSGKARQYLINPLTGVLEPMSSESSEEEEMEAAEFPLSPVDTKSDSEDSALNGSLGLGSAPVTPLHAVHAPSVLGQQPLPQAPAQLMAPAEEVRAAEKLKLRLKLDKSAPYNVCYTSATSERLSSAGAELRGGLPDQSSEPRVPPLHISLRGRNAAVVKRCRERKREGKARKKSDATPPPPPPAMAPESPEPEKALTPADRPLSVSASVSTSPALTVSSGLSLGLLDRQPPLQVSAYPTEAEVASILRSVPEVTTDEKKRKRSHPKSLTPLRPQLEDKRRKVVNSTAAHSSPSSGSLVKNLIKHLAKDHPRMDKVERDRERERERERLEREREVKKEDISSSPEAQTIVPFISNGRNKSADYACKSSPPGSAAPQPSQASPQVTPGGYPAKPSPGDKAPGLDKAGEDSGIESMDALSEKSPNRGDSPNRKEETLKKEGPILMKGGEGVEDVDEDSVEDPVPIRLTPALYTYSNPEKQREGSPPLEIVKTDYPANRSRSNSLSGGKSLLEQLLIEIPGDAVTRRASNPTPTTNGRNHRLATRSPDEPPAESPAPPSPVKRGRKASESSTASHDEAPTTRSKRKCSENASELIKACIGTGAPADGAAQPQAPAAAQSPVQAPTPEDKKRKESTEEEEVVEKRTASNAEDRPRPKEDEKIKAGGRRSARQEVKRTIHRKRQRSEDTPAPQPPETKLRRRATAKEAAK